MKIGDEVVINIARPDGWTDAYYKALNGQKGIVTKWLGTNTFSSYEWGKPAWEVTFKVPVPMPDTFSNIHQSHMAESFNFDESDLVPYMKFKAGDKVYFRGLPQTKAMYIESARRKYGRWLYKLKSIAYEYEEFVLVPYTFEEFWNSPKTVELRNKLK